MTHMELVGWYAIGFFVVYVLLCIRNHRNFMRRTESLKCYMCGIGGNLVNVIVDHRSRTSPPIYMCPECIATMNKNLKLK